MGVELELYLLVVLLTVSSSLFAPFEVETPARRKMLKWLIMVGGTVGLYYAFGHLAILLPLVGGATGLTVHFAWCRKHGIHPLHTTPRRRYYELRQWEWRD